MDKVARRGSRKSSEYARKGYKSKSHILELQAQGQQAALQRLQQESAYLQLKGTVLELLLEVASEIVVHKRKYIDVNFPELADQQLLEFLDEFLGKYGGYNAVGPTERNLFHLERLKVEDYQSLTPQSFTERYTALVQRLSLMLLQATDDSMKGGLMTTVSDLKQLLIGALLWNPLVFHTVSAHHLVNGEVVTPDPDHSEITISGVCLDARQSEVLLIIAGMYSSSVKKLEQQHAALAEELNTEMQEDVPAELAAVIMKMTSNAYRLEATHQLYHTAVIQALLDQQLAHMCVRCFPRFPAFRDLLAALERLSKHRTHTTTTMQAAALGPAAAAVAAAAAAGLSIVPGAGSAAAAAAAAAGGGSSSAAGSAGNAAGGAKTTSTASGEEAPTAAAAAAAPAGSGDTDVPSVRRETDAASASAAAAAAGSAAQQQQQQSSRAAAAAADEDMRLPYGSSSKLSAAVRHSTASSGIGASQQQQQQAHQHVNVKLEHAAAAAAVADGSDRHHQLEYSSSKAASQKRKTVDVSTSSRAFPPAKRGRPPNSSKSNLYGVRSPVHPAAAAGGGLDPATVAGLGHMGELDPAAAAALPVPLPPEVAARLEGRISSSQQQQQQYGLGQFAAMGQNAAAGGVYDSTAAAAAGGGDLNVAAALIKQILQMMHLPTTTPAQQQQLATALNQLVMQERQRQQQQQQQQQQAMHGLEGMLQAAMGMSTDGKSWRQQHTSQTDMILAAAKQLNGPNAPSVATKLLENLMMQQQQRQQQTSHQGQQNSMQQQLSKALGSTLSSSAAAGSSMGQSYQQLMRAVADMLKAVSDVAEAAAAAEAAAPGSSNAAVAAAEAALLAAAKAIQGVRARNSTSGTQNPTSQCLAAADHKHAFDHAMHYSIESEANADVKPFLGSVAQQGRLGSSSAAAAAAALASLPAVSQAQAGWLTGSSSRAFDSDYPQQQHDDQHAQQLAHAVDALKQLSQLRDHKAPTSAAAAAAAATPTAVADHHAAAASDDDDEDPVAAAAAPRSSDTARSKPLNGLVNQSASALLDLLSAAAARGGTAAAAGSSGGLQEINRSHDGGSSPLATQTPAAAAAAGDAANMFGALPQQPTGLSLLRQLQGSRSNPPRSQQQQQGLQEPAEAAAAALGSKQSQTQQRPASNLTGEELLTVMLSLLGKTTPSSAATDDGRAAAAATPVAAAVTAASPAHKDGRPPSMSGFHSRSVPVSSSGPVSGGLAGLLGLLEASQNAAAVAATAAEMPSPIRQGHAAALTPNALAASGVAAGWLGNAAGGSSSNGIAHDAAVVSAAMPRSSSSLKLTNLPTELLDSAGNPHPLAALALVAAASQQQQQGVNQETLDAAGGGSQICDQGVVGGSSSSKFAKGEFDQTEAVVGNRSGWE